MSSNNFLSLCKLIRDNTIDDAKISEIINFIDNFFLWACKSGEKDIAEWIYNLSKRNPGTKIDIHEDNEYLFRVSCTYGNLEMAKWLYNISKIDNNIKINIRIFDDYVFINSCSSGSKEIAEWLCTICNDYKISYQQGNMVPCIWNIKVALTNSSQKELEKLFSTSEVSTDDSDCMVCFDNENKFRIKLGCNHEVCLSCFINIDRCPYRCTPSIDINDIKLIKVVNQ